MIELFFNEWSLQEQFYERSAFEHAVARFLALAERGRKATQGGKGKLWRSERMETYRAMPGQSLRASLNAISNRELREEFCSIVFDRACPAPWEPDALHQAEDSYCWRDHDLEESISGTSIAELAERQLRDESHTGCLINFQSSSLNGHLSITIAKNGGETVSVDCCDARPRFETWLAGIGVPLPYSATMSEPPRDVQTCLVDSFVYEATSLFQQGRRVFRRRTDGAFLCVDNLHWGAAAHLEVFDKRRYHLGEASLDGVLRPGTRVRGRRLLDE